MFKVELFRAALHYDILCEWWEKQGFPVPPLDILPKLGFMVYNNEINEYVYGGFIIFTNTPIAWAEWLVSNPFVQPTHKRRALKEGLLFIFSEIRFRRSSVRYVFTTTLNGGLVNSLKKCDFKVGDTNMTQLIYEL